ncbi:ParA family protein [Brevibacillus brevis]|uniref:ParA family protein n=1 Tax=Brevibacillus brevis TaxID=1393 RepID=A0A517IDL7_BREBE|nr:AAA family ATPase [Brevibacillus brevis]QDS36967.1 ParA family protein [Brevibacillus brevis]
MKAIAMFNNKGGVGKTTLVCNLVGYLSLELGKKVLVIDADPQCNTTINILPEEQFEAFYYEKKAFTIYDILRPLHRGQGYSENINFYNVENFGVDFLIGDPRLSLMEDLLSNDWKDATSGEPRGLRTTLVFSDLLRKCSQYDYVFFDMGPSLGSLNRSILLACDYFLTPMSLDIFSLLALENIGQTMDTWKKRFTQGVNNNLDPEALEGLRTEFNIKFAGYVTQQYTAKVVDGVKRPVKAFDQILTRVPELIKNELIDKINDDKEGIVNYELGSIPNFHSLIPISQSAHKPIFNLEYGDGVVGAHFSKVEEFKEIIHSIAIQLLENVEAVS